MNAAFVKSFGRNNFISNLNGGHEYLIRNFGGKYSILSGHIHFYGEGLDPRYVYTTILREPVERAISWISFILNNHSDGEIDEVKAAALNFVNSDGEIFDEGILFELKNYMTRHFSSITDGITDGNIETALKNLSNYNLIGFFDKLEKFTHEFQLLAQSTVSHNTQKQNESIKKINPTRKLIEKITELNKLDLQLYEVAKKLYFPLLKNTDFEPRLFPKQDEIFPKEGGHFYLISAQNSNGRLCLQGDTHEIELKIYSELSQCDLHMKIIFRDAADFIVYEKIFTIFIQNSKIIFSKFKFSTAPLFGKYSITFQFSTEKDSYTAISEYPNILELEVFTELKKIDYEGVVDLHGEIDQTSNINIQSNLATNNFSGSAEISLIRSEINQKSCKSLRIRIINRSKDFWLSTVKSQLNIAIGTMELNYINWRTILPICKNPLHPNESTEITLDESKILSILDREIIVDLFMGNEIRLSNHGFSVGQRFIDAS